MKDKENATSNGAIVLQSLEILHPLISLIYIPWCGIGDWCEVDSNDYDKMELFMGGLSDALLTHSHSSNESSDSDNTSEDWN